MSEQAIVDSTFSAIINAPLDKIDIPHWCFTLSEREYQGSSPAHVAGGFNTTPDGKRVSVNVEVIGGSLMVHHYVEKSGQKDSLVFESVSDVFTPSGRTTINVNWELSAKAIDSVRSEFTNRVKATATKEFVTFLDRQGIPLDVYATQLHPMINAHNKQETPLFAASIERAAFRN